MAQPELTVKMFSVFLRSVLDRSNFSQTSTAMLWANLRVHFQPTKVSKLALTGFNFKQKPLQGTRVPVEFDHKISNSWQERQTHRLDELWFGHTEQFSGICSLQLHSTSSRKRGSNRSVECMMLSLSELTTLPSNYFPSAAVPWYNKSTKGLKLPTVDSRYIFLQIIEMLCFDNAV